MESEQSDPSISNLRIHLVKSPFNGKNSTAVGACFLRPTAGEQFNESASRAMRPGYLSGQRKHVLKVRVCGDNASDDSS